MTKEARLTQKRLEEEIEAMKMNQDPSNCISYWLPILRSCGVKMPETIIEKADNSIINILDGKESKRFDNLISRLQKAGDKVGYPCFLRSGHTSHKHGWKDSCCVVKRENMGRHVVDIMEFACCCDMMGLPYDVWAIRELLPLKTSFTAFYGNMPINKERRYFINDGKMICHHPYWPEFVFEDQRKLPDDWREQLAELNDESEIEIKLLTILSGSVADKFPGYWSVDWAMTTDGGWYAIDMAMGKRSFHWSDCKKVLT